MGVVLAAPLAVAEQGFGGTSSISGARSLSDQVSVTLRHGAKQGATTDVHLLAFNDLHGNLEPAGTTSTASSPVAPRTSPRLSRTGRRRTATTQATVFAGDNIGASPLANGLFYEEPITIASNLMNVDFASVGNHEFDKGSAELKRIQNGGCHPADGCTGAPYALSANGVKSTDVYPGADFQYLSTNVVVDATGKTLFPAYADQEVQVRQPARSSRSGSSARCSRPRRRSSRRPALPA